MLLEYCCTAIIFYSSPLLFTSLISNSLSIPLSIGSNCRSVPPRLLQLLGTGDTGLIQPSLIQHRHTNPLRGAVLADTGAAAPTMMATDEESESHVTNRAAVIFAQLPDWSKACFEGFRYSIFLSRITGRQTRQTSDTATINSSKEG